jgi:hypothetical protein
VQLDDIARRLVQALSAVAQLGVRARALLAGVGRQLDAVDGEHLSADQAQAVAGQQHLRKQRLDLLAQLAHELGNVGVARLRVATNSHELHVLRTGALDRAAGDQPPAVGQKNDLEHDARVVGTGAGFVVAETRVQPRQVQFMIDQQIQREFERATLDLLVQHHGQQPRAAIYGLVAGHGIGMSDAMPLSTVAAAAAMTSFKDRGRVFAQPQRKANLRRSRAAAEGTQRSRDARPLGVRLSVGLGSGVTVNARRFGASHGFFNTRTVPQ